MHGERERLLDVNGAAEFLSMSVSWIYKAVAANTIPHVRVGRAVRFAPAALAEWIEKNTRE